MPTVLESTTDYTLLYSFFTVFCLFFKVYQPDGCQNNTIWEWFAEWTYRYCSLIPYLYLRNQITRSMFHSMSCGIEFGLLSLCSPLSYRWEGDCCVFQWACWQENVCPMITMLCHISPVLTLICLSALFIRLCKLYTFCDPLIDKMSYWSLRPCFYIAQLQCATTFTTVFISLQGYTGVKAFSLNVLKFVGNQLHGLIKVGTACTVANFLWNQCIKFTLLIDGNCFFLYFEYWIMIFYG